MATLADYWPPYALRIDEGDLRLTVITDDDLPELIDLVLRGIHDPGFMPFSEPWTRMPADRLPGEFIRWAARAQASFSAAAFDLNLTVRVGGDIVGMQALETKDFGVRRSGETGSWLGRAFQGRGIGTRMRRAVCAFAFDHLGAAEVTSGAFVDNPQSIAVSRKVGYVDNGRARVNREGVAVEHLKLVLRPETFVRGEPVEVTGAEALRRFVGLDQPIE